MVVELEKRPIAVNTDIWHFCLLILGQDWKSSDKHSRLWFPYVVQILKMRSSSRIVWEP